MSELLTRVAAAETARRKSAAQRLFAVVERAATQQDPAPDDAGTVAECLGVLDWDARGLKGYLESVRRTLAAREARKHVPELDAALKAAFAAKNKTDAEFAERLQQLQAETLRAEREHSRQIAAARNAFQAANDTVSAGEGYEKVWDSLFKGERIDPLAFGGLQPG